MRKTLWQKVNSIVTTTIIIALCGISVTAVACLDVVQSASATTDMMTRTLGEQESLNTTSISSNNSNNSDSVLGMLFLTGEDRLTETTQSTKHTLRYRM